MILQIVKYGDERLRVKSEQVVAIDASVRALVKDMLQTMYANNGAGLAAEQVGREERVCVIDVSYGREEDVPPWSANPDVAMPIILINPELVAQEGREVGQEGCLSFPEIYINVARSASVTVEYTDLEGRRCTLEAGGLLARAIQHEIDHLDGVLLVDHMTHVQKVAVSGKLRRIRRQAAGQTAAVS